MAESENHIPTLTNVVHEGNESMLNHFDAHQFSDEPKDESEFSNITENASEFENSIAEEIPSILLDEDNETELPDQDFSDAMQLENDTVEKSPDNTELKEKIDLAVEEILPGIEAQLKDHLYKKLGI